ncbi:ABC-F family ATP-binding cassette domain-containing protein [Gilvibacter sediminis]|uniref:ABC-F family ATP-binding cassette domain-containing protein n=1 Tax=Gilvibacter sediminis TaxID=379071 RepID=UPI00234FBFDC|nr:ABC-F family ATP-binding cassette domain-containing protein [Gilvibacter sediminis]MDC7999282.1 ABC-F family ATP-binding cassette domain-containing protein [Gilvibacter sediminis]
MNYVSVEHIAKAYGERVLFEDISFGINQGQKIGFVAKNGTGKTAILNILAKTEAPDSGQVVFRKELNVAYLPQEPSLRNDLTVKETIYHTDSPTLQIIDNYHVALKNPDDTEGLQRAFDAMEAAQAWDFENRIETVLSKFQLTKLDQKVANLSGGQKKRLALAHALINIPDLLILDEPTNHLDLQMIEWLEAFFTREKVSLFMVTHDRYFLDRVCNEIVELDNGQWFSYKGNYAYYLDKRQARMEQFEVETDKAVQLYKKELDWMRRQPKARTTKSKSRIDDFHEIKARAHQRRKQHELQLELNMERLGTKIAEFHKVSKAFGDKVITQNFEYRFQRGERVGIIGNNGSGKSSFLNMLTGVSQPDAGKIVIGETVKFGYYSQAGIEVKPGQKVIDVIREFGDYIPLKKGRQLSAGQLLERFLFDRKKQYDYVEKLSGGERKRLYLCTVLIGNPNFLILDEPTNDLDIVTLNVLESFLLDYPGCLIVVSHDRYFMDKVVDHLLVFRGDGLIEDFPGNYSDFRAYEDSSDPVAKSPKKEKTDWKDPKAKAKLSYNEQKEYKALERDIAKLEREKDALEAAFATADWDTDKINEESLKLQELINSLEQKTERWFELSMKLEE